MSEARRTEFTQKPWMPTSAKAKKQTPPQSRYFAMAHPKDTNDVSERPQGDPPSRYVYFATFFHLPPHVRRRMHLGTRPVGERDRVQTEWAVDDSVRPEKWMVIYEPKKKPKCVPDSQPPILG